MHDSAQPVRVDKWLWAARLVKTRALGSDAVKGGRVEIAYYTFPPYEARGFGKAMAERLVDLAISHPDVVDVVAHTLPAESASTRILRGLHFRPQGGVHLTDEGRVWRWVLPRQVRHEKKAAGWVPMNRAAAFLSMLA